MAISLTNNPLLASFKLLRLSLESLAHLTGQPDQTSDSRPLEAEKNNKTNLDLGKILKMKFKSSAHKQSPNTMYRIEASYVKGIIV